eukprot:161480-Rhodomonas_salina.1
MARESRAPQHSLGVADFNIDFGFTPSTPRVSLPASPLTEEGWWRELIRGARRSSGLSGVQSALRAGGRREGGAESRSVVRPGSRLKCEQLYSHLTSAAS